MRFGIVGCGVIGKTHAAAISGLAGAELLGVADPVHERADALADSHGASVYPDLASMLAAEPVDVVTICTASGMHGTHAREAMHAGKHVIVEKPIEITLPAIDDLLRVQREMGVKLAVISQHRFDPAAQRVHELLRAGAFGTPVLATAHILWWRSQEYYDSGDWRGSWALDGGGVLMNQSIHAIDLLQWFMGPVRSVCAYTGTLAHRMETEDTAVAALRFSSGALGSIAATTSAYPGVSTRLEILGSEGSAVMIRLSAFADEISPDLDEQITVLHEQGVHLVELRSVWNTNVLDLSDGQVARVQERFEGAGIRVSAIGSPLGKAPVDVPVEDELRRLERAIELAQRFGASMIRIFSFYPPSSTPGQEPGAYREEVMERLSRMAALTAGSGVTLLHENDTDLYGDTIERCLDVLETVQSPQVKAAFDPANFIVSGEAPYPDAYDALQPWLAHVHVKDARADRTVVVAGEGVARWLDLLARLRSDGYDGIFSIEPHLQAAGQYGGFSGPDLFRRATQAFCVLLQRMDWEYL